MKKLITISILLIGIFFVALTSYCAETPVYDASFNNNDGAFYANGAEITISENSNGETVITWAGGSQVVPETVYVFGGGNGESSYESSNITMNGGIVSFLVGGGISLEEGKSAVVNNAKITVNNGTVLEGVIGGGFLYSTVDNTEITINDGTVAAVGGGGLAFAVIDGKSYSSGTEEDPQNSGDRTNNVNIVINGGTINSPSLNYGLVYGGGQGYSYVGTTKVVINGGDLTKSYLTAGGSNGYTGNATLEINGGKINIVQSVNRGTVNSANITVNGGTITKFYVGGETEDSSVTGTINQVKVELLGGNIETLEPGKSNSEKIEINNNEYSVIKTDSININNDNISSGEVTITYTFTLEPTSLTLQAGDSAKLQATITTTPNGYEYLYEDSIIWNSANDNIATVSQDGTVTGESVGSTVITASLLDKEQSVNVTVESNSTFYIIAIILSILIFIFLLIVLGSIVCCC